MRTGRDPETLSRVNKAAAELTEKSGDFQFLFPLRLQDLRTKAARALLNRATLSENGVVQSDPRYVEAKDASDKNLREFEIFARVELGLEPDLETPLTRERQSEAPEARASLPK